MLAMPDIPQSTPRPAATVLDAASLQRLHELDPQGTNRVVERVLRTFEVSLQRLLAQAADAARAGDAESARHAAHTLKSSSASVGALALSRCCAEIEHQLRSQPLAALQGPLDELQDEGRRVLQAVRDHLPD